MFVIYIISFLYALNNVFNNESDENIDILIQKTNMCGTLAIKLVQYLIMREKINHHKIKYVFEKCLVHPIEYTEENYFNDFGKNIHDDYIIDDNPLVFSGSIGQVYKLYSKKYNKYIALKTKHPGVNENVNTFVRIIKTFCYLFGSYNKYNNIMLEFVNNALFQLDYILEAKNTILFREKWINETGIVVPEVYEYSDNFIIMSYHEATDFNDLNNKDKLRASLYINFIIITSVAIHDLLHADLHTGNWKIIKENDTMKLLVYDCGIMCTTGDIELNRNIVYCILSYSFTELLYIISDNNNKHKVDECSNYIKRNLPSKNSDKLRFFVETAVDRRLISNKKIINVLSAFAFVSKICDINKDIYSKYTGYDNKSYQITIYIHIELLKCMGTFIELKEFLEDWMNSDVKNKERYNFWLFDTFGHTKSHIVGNIIYNKAFIENKK